MQKKGISSSRKEFQYPPILPIVYYEGTGEWTAAYHLKDRIFMIDIFQKYIPDFTYELISLHSFSNHEIIENQNEISLILLLNKLQCAEDFKNLPNMQKLWQMCKNSPEYLVDIITKIFTLLLSKMNLPQEDVEEYIGNIKEGTMPELFENFQKIDIQAARKQAMAEGRAEGRAQGRAEGRAEGLTTGRAQGRLKVLIELILPLIEKGCRITEITNI